MIRQLNPAGVPYLGHPRLEKSPSCIAEATSKILILSLFRDEPDIDVHNLAQSLQMLDTWKGGYAVTELGMYYIS